MTKINNYLVDWIERAAKVNLAIDSLQEEKKELDKEAKAQGYEPKILRAILAMKEQEKSKLDEYHAKLRAYAESVGFQLPLGL